MHRYLDMLRHIIATGNDRGDRTGVGTRSVFGYQARFDLSEGFPLVTTKRVYWKAVVRELLWFLTGSTNIRPLVLQGVTIWTDWPLDRYRRASGDEISREDFEKRIIENDDFAREWGELGPVYGKQWVDWPTYEAYEDGFFRKGPGINQVAEVIHSIRNNPDSRRHIIEGWNVAELDQMALPPCHKSYQFYVADGKLSCHMYQRSADALLGVPFNIASGSLFTMMIAQICDLEVAEFIHSFGDLHLYNNHFDQAQLQLEREPKPLPTMQLNPERREIDEFVFEDFTLEGYDPHPAIKADIAV